MDEQDGNFSGVDERAKQKLEQDMGPLLMDALNDPRTVELMLNADGGVWQERLGESMKYIGTLRSAQGESIIRTTVASYHGNVVTRGGPIVEGELPLDGSRFAGQVPPIVTSPTFAIRKNALSIFTLDQYVEAAIMTRKHGDTIKAAVKTHRNILVTGGTGSGKTTLVNAIINEMTASCPFERICIIEDVRSACGLAAPVRVEVHAVHCPRALSVRACCARNVAALSGLCHRCRCAGAAGLPSTTGGQPASGDVGCGAPQRRLQHDDSPSG
jgi:Flp pilus assembly CpaF family ATPase